MHCHSTCSDGTESPAQVLSRALAAGVKLFCLTDHDGWGGFDQLTGSASGDTTLVRAAEISCSHQGKTVHLLAYGLSEGPGLTALAERLASLRRARHRRVHELCAKLQALSVNVSPAEIVAQAGSEAPGRPHVAAALVKAGVVSSVTEAFRRFLRDGGPADVPPPRLELEEAIPLAREAGARLSLAHPFRLGPLDQIRALFQTHRARGLDGIEAFYGLHTRRQTRALATLAGEMSLTVTAGSDYHGPTVNPQVQTPGMELPEPHVGRLLRWLGLS